MFGGIAMKTMRLLVAAAAMPLCMLPAMVQAQDAGEGPEWEIDGEIAAFTDYRFRGVSLSGKNPQATAEVTVSHQSGFYFGAWASTVDIGNGNDDLEVDLYAGYATDLGGLSFDIGALYYAYPGNGSFDYFELVSTVGTSVGSADISVGVAYAPSQGALGNVDNTYLFISGEVPIGNSPLSIHGTFGWEDGAFGNSKRDWLAGVTLDAGSGISLTVDYVDSARSGTSLGDPTVVGSVALAF